RVEAVYLRRKAPVPSRWHIQYFEPVMDGGIAAGDVSCVIGRAVIYDDPANRAHRLGNDRLNSFLDERLFVSSGRHQYVFHARRPPSARVSGNSASFCQ